MASSTIKPVANTSASKVNMLIEKPSPQMIAKAPANEIGMDRAGTIVARQLPMNNSSVSTTKPIVKLNDRTTSLTESRINSASSFVTTIFKSLKRRLRRSTITSTSSEISMVLELACLIIPNPTTGEPSKRTILLASEGLK